MTPLETLPLSSFDIFPLLPPPLWSALNMVAPFMITHDGAVHWFVDPNAPGVFAMPRGCAWSGGPDAIMLGNQRAYGDMVARNLAAAHKPEVP